MRDVIGLWGNPPIRSEATPPFIRAAPNVFHGDTHQMNNARRTFSSHRTFRTLRMLPNMQAPVPFYLRSGHIYMKDSYYVDPNGKSNFRFLFFELWLLVFTIFGDTYVTDFKKYISKLAKCTGKMREIWSILH